jgi:hypothetical protein
MDLKSIVNSVKNGDYKKYGIHYENDELIINRKLIKNLLSIVVITLLIAQLKNIKSEPEKSDKSTDGIFKDHLLSQLLKLFNNK